MKVVQLEAVQAGDTFLVRAARLRLRDSVTWLQRDRVAQGLDEQLEVQGKKTLAEGGACPPRAFPVAQL